MKGKDDKKDVLMLKKGEGRKYKCGNMTAIFKADEQETDAKYSVSEWWIDPNSKGPGEHIHENIDHIFYVLEGRLSILLEKKWVDAEKGAFVRIPAKTMHTFANRTDKKAGMLDLNIPGGFERDLPSMVKWFEDNK
jgi:mannose-6-phosphate isomerase-like protein (cupin superfamily)